MLFRSIATSGPSYATKRKEAAESMVELLQVNPELFGVAGDIFVKNLDWPGAKELAKRLKKTIDPKLLTEEDDPMMQQAKQQIEQMGAQMQQMQQMLENVQKSFEAREIAVKEQEVRIKAYDAETKRIVAMRPADPVQGQAVEQVVQPPPLDPNKFMLEQSKHALQDKQHEHEAGMARLNAGHAAEAAEQQAALQPQSEVNE